MALLATRVGIIAAMMYILVLRYWAFFLVHGDHWSGQYSIAWIVIVLALTGAAFVVARAGRPLLPDLLEPPPRR